MVFGLKFKVEKMNNFSEMWWKVGEWVDFEMEKVVFRCFSVFWVESDFCVSVNFFNDEDDFEAKAATMFKKKQKPKMDEKKKENPKKREKGEKREKV